MKPVESPKHIKAAGKDLLDFHYHSSRNHSAPPNNGWSRNWDIAGAYSFSIITFLASPEWRPDISASATAELTVNPFQEVLVNFLPQEENSIEPGGIMATQLLIQNTGNVWDNFSLNINTYPEWSVISVNYVELYPSEVANVILELRPPRQPSLLPGITSHIIQATSQLDALIFDTTSLDIEILPFHEVKVEVQPNSSVISPGESTDYVFTVENLGNIIDDYQINIMPMDFSDAYFSYPSRIQLNWVEFDNPGIFPSERGWYGTFNLNPSQLIVIGFSITIPTDWAGFENTTYELKIGAILEINPVIFDLISMMQEVTPTYESKKQYVNWEIGQLRQKVQDSPIEYWMPPSNNRIETMCNKLGELIDLISTNALGEGYLKLLHDIKPKLTGIKADENDSPFGNGEFDNAWVTNDDMKQELNTISNQILAHITILILL